MSSILKSLKPKAGFSHFIHIFLLLLLPAILFALVSLRWYEIATAVVLLSKWRMLAIKPRHWLASIRANTVDIIVGLSLLVFMSQSGSMQFRLIWTLVYAGWLIVLKRRSDQSGVALQALTAQILGLSALFIHWGDKPLLALVALGWFICYMSARHFFSAFEDPLNRYLSSIWGYFAASIIWILTHLLLFYGFMAVPTLFLSVVAFGLGGVYYLEKTDRLSAMIRRQVLFIMIIVVIILLAGLVRHGYILKSQQ